MVTDNPIQKMEISIGALHKTHQCSRRTMHRAQKELHRLAKCQNEFPKWMKKNRQINKRNEYCHPAFEWCRVMSWQPAALSHCIGGCHFYFVCRFSDCRTRRKNSHSWLHQWQFSFAKNCIIACEGFSFVFPIYIQYNQQMDTLDILVHSFLNWTDSNTSAFNTKGIEIACACGLC